MDVRKTKRAVSWLVNTPFHPQWLLARSNRKYLERLGSNLSGSVLDIGCGHQAIRQYLTPACDYTGVDNYATAVAWYGSRPDAYAISDQLPFRDRSFTCVLLLDVLEHLPSGIDTMREINRVLQTDGRVYIQVPFLYPVHDAPLDYCRWTTSGLDKLFHHSGFERGQTEIIGSPVETAVLLLNIALSKSVINCWNSRNPLFLLVVVLPVVIPALNIIALFFALFSPPDHFMPFRYRVTAIKKTDMRV